MKKVTVLIMALALLAMTAGKAPAETYVEGYIGNNFMLTSPNPLEFDVNPNYKGPVKTSLEFPRTLTSSLIFGAKLGTWFSKQGFPKVDYPDWMKYLGFYIDFTWQGLDSYALVKGDLIDKTMGSRRMTIVPSPAPYYQHYQFSVDHGASIVTLAFMFPIRYGFFPTEKVPFGKLQPYAAVGPAIFISSFKPNILFQPNTKYELIPVLQINSPTPRVFSGSFKTAVTLGLATELGLRYMITRFLSVETSVKYRLTRPSLSYDIEIDGFTHRLTFAPQLNQFSIQTGVAYHF